jgi:hypothetical protein
LACSNKILLKFGLIGKYNGSSIAASSDATQVGSFANLCAGDATKLCKVLYSLLVGGRDMFSLNPYIVQIAA